MQSDTGHRVCLFVARILAKIIDSCALVIKNLTANAVHAACATVDCSSFRQNLAMTLRCSKRVSFMSWATQFGEN